MWPFGRKQDKQAAAPAPEDRAGPYTDAIIEQIIRERGQASPTDARSTAALEAAAGVIGRAFASVEVRAAGAVWGPATPELMHNIGRDLVVHGEAVLVRIGVAVVRASQWDVRGASAEPTAWTYRIDVPSPDGDRTVMRNATEVAHVRWSSHPARPWLGVGPLALASSSAALMGSLENRMAEEAGAATGHLLPIPAGGDDASVAALKSDLARLQGKTAIVETTYAGWGEGRTAAPQRDWQPSRIGANWPATTPAVYTAAQLSVMAACGVPVELIAPSEGGGMREAWRRCLHGTLEPLGRMVAAELSNIARLPVTLDFSALMASDISGRARAFQSLVGAGMDVQAAASVSGVLSNDGDGR